MRENVIFENIGTNITQKTKLIDKRIRSAKKLLLIIRKRQLKSFRYMTRKEELENLTLTEHINIF